MDILERPNLCIPEITEEGKQKIAKLLKAFYDETYITGNDYQTKEYILEWCRTNNLPVTTLLEYLQSSIYHGEWSCLRAFCYNYEIGTPKNERLALRWYKIAAANKDSFAANQIGWFYQNGLSTRKNNEKAIKYFEKSAREGHPHGCSNLGHAYRWVNMRAAFYWYLRAAETGYPSAYKYVGCCYQDGAGCVKDPHEFLRWSVRYEERRKEIENIKKKAKKDEVVKNLVLFQINMFET
ncbi:13326_t:CDS:2 [Ambispora leptoticha]|uniref:13326_t:CDS:1 n=1 Tax=Ambispora leptoticha TaxID=144679 RepID=A0A9N9C1X6_9GLOM|nr:13326_t:CDS:2 [Ambispora leptoticha]